MLTVATWNINSLRARLPLVLRYLDERSIDVLCLQETRTSDAAFPRSEFDARGYHVAATGTGGYAGVAIVSRAPIEEVVVGLSGFVEAKAPGRRIACRTGGAWIDTVYVPTRMKIGKAEFLDALRVDRAERFGSEGILAGDFNICWDARDYASRRLITDPEIHPGRPEDLAFRRLIEPSLLDCFRKREQGSGHFSWFPVATWALKRNYGMRLDYVFASPALAAHVVEATHDRETRSWPRPSDHLPVRVGFDLPSPATAHS
jgi:exodeoxyribonuclease-3